MKKLIKFSPNSTKYFDIAEEKYHEGALEHAIYYYYQSYIKRKDINTLLAIGETYCDMGQPKEGLKYLFLALDSAPGDAEICHSIAQAFLDMDEDEIAFYYFQPHMTMEQYISILEDTANEIKEPRIKLVEKSADALPNIALKLMNSGDTEYAREILLTIKPTSEHYVAANNILSLTSLEAGNAKEGQEFAQKALSVKDNIDSRCNLMLSYYLLGDYENAEKCSQYIESQKLDLNQRKTVSLSYIRMDDAKKALKHLKVLYDAFKYNKDTMVSYALALYNSGELEYAKQVMALAAKAYPKDIIIKETSAAMHRGEKLTLYPLLEDKTTNDFLQEIEEKLTIATNTENDFFEDESFREKIDWLFQSHIVVGQSKAVGILGKHKRWHTYLKECLLDNSINLSVKKVCLYTLLYYGVRGSLGIVISGLYFKIQIKFPATMDEIFRAAYCMAFASFAFSDSNFEDRIYKISLKILKKYRLLKDKKLDDALTLAAVIFYVTGHKKISQTLTCAHLFGCDVKKLEDYLNTLDLKK